MCIFFLVKMLSEWLWFFILCTICITVQSLPAAVEEDAKKNEQLLRPKVKRTQELLMFGNQQNHQATDNNAASNFSPPANKRTLSNSGLDDVSSSLTETEKQPTNRLKALSNGYIMDQPNIPLHEKNYEYGKVLVNEVGDVLPRGSWELTPHGRYYGISNEDRRKRSEDSNSNSPSISSSTSSSATLTSSSTTLPVASPVASAPASKPVIGQLKRSIPAYYQEPRYKRESELDPEEYLALLSFYDNERRNRGNWRNYANDEYETVDDDSNIIGIDDEDPRTGSQWLDTSLGYPQQHHYLANDPLLNSDLAILGRNRPNNYYEQYMGQQYGGSGNQQYDTSLQYGTPQYGIPYIQHAYYPPEKRFMMNRKRSQNYDTYGDRSGAMMNARGYLNYKNRLLY